MPQKAQVRSIDAIEAFRSNLVVYLSQARPALEEVSAEVLRTKVWLETDRRTHWENQVRRRAKQLEQAQAALFSARLGVLKKESAADQLAFHRAKRAFEEAEAKLRVLKRWDREFDSRVQPLLKQTEKLHTLLAHDMVNALAYLTQVISTLAAYAEMKPALGEPPAAAPEPVVGGAGSPGVKEDLPA
jgi:hypothetical protein